MLLCSRRSPQYERFAHDERRGGPLDEEAALKPPNADAKGAGLLATDTEVLLKPAVVVVENLLTLESVSRTGFVKCLQLDQDALVACREGLKSW